MANRDVRAILQDDTGRFWFGTLGGLSSYQNGQFTNYTERDGLSSNHIRTLYKDEEGTLWIGTYDAGLNRFKDGKFTRYMVGDGLFNNGVFCILEDARGNFWISSNRGIYRVSRQELNDFAAGKSKSITSVAYDKSDGMLSSECNGGYQPAGWKTRAGRLWFPTQGGVVVIAPETVRQSQPPPVHIEEVLLDQAPATFRDVLRVAPQQDNVEIHFTALSYSKPEQVQFKYKLTGFDNDRVDARTRRSA